MKYEMIFGDEKLFDGAPWDSVCVERFINPELVSVYVHYCTIDALLNTLIEREAVSCASNRPDIAIRRIIKEPKRWTWEDKKAGRLPEVLGKVTTYDGKTYLFVGESCHDNQWSLKDDATGKVYHTPIGDILPIETPAEKAQREEDEFINSMLAKGVVYMSDYIEGLRAAYRKLRGGEK